MNRYVLFFLFHIAFSGIIIAEDEDYKCSIYTEQNEVYSPTERYTILKTLGEGLFGKVYLVEDPQGVKYALKSYKRHENPLYAESLLALGEREFLCGQFLNHPHIVKTFDYFVSNSSTSCSDNLLLQYIEGKTVSKINKGYLTKGQAAISSIDLCDTLLYALNLGFIYRDLSEENLMINTQKEIFIIDLAGFFTLEEILSISKGLKDLFPWIESGALFKLNSKDEERKIHFNYFERICDILVSILCKSNIQRGEKIDLQIQIKKITLNYKEDIEEEVEIPFINYLNNLKDFIKDWGEIYI
jgi:hypothetical protein